jgi:hypothetical protein
VDRLALEWCNAEFGRRPPQERVDEQELVEVELPRSARRSEPGLDLECGAAARRQCPLRGHSPAGDEEGAHVTGLARRNQDAALTLSHPVEAVQLATHSLEGGDAIPEPARVLESPRLRQLAEAMA